MDACTVITNDERKPGLTPGRGFPATWTALRLSSLSAVAALAIALATVTAGCGTHHGYAVLASFPHKDAIEVTVFVDAALDVDSYRSIASRELTRFLSLHDPSPHPLYEFNVEFRRAEHPYQRLASLNIELGEPGAPAQASAQADEVSLAPAGGEGGSGKSGSGEGGAGAGVPVAAVAGTWTLVLYGSDQ